ncbi:MAG: hypothetical protein ACK5Q5_10005 [Planctomycetaceae bacterium]
MLLLALMACLSSQWCHAADFRDGFESESPTWKVSADGNNATQLRDRERTSQLVHEGSRAEMVRVHSARRGGTLYLEQTVPPALVFDELTASVWVRCNRPGLQLGVRIVFPSQVDPRSETKQLLTADFWGESCLNTHRWQRLSCRTTDAEVRQLLSRLRSQIGGALATTDIDTHGMSVDQVLLRHALEAGESEYALDTLQLSPFIDPAANGTEIVQTKAEQAIVAPVTMGDGRLLRDGRPYFPVFTRYHGEPLEQLRQSGFNLMLIPKYDDLPLLKSLEQAGLGAMCEPPALQVKPPEQTGDVAYNVGLPRFTADTNNILMWHLGADVSPEALASVRAASNAVRDADRYRRPILVDVQGNIREFHRTVDVVGYSKHAMQTSLGPQEYFQFLQRESLAALRGKPTFTWVFTEPNPANLENRAAEAIQPQLEPEQIWMQVYAAIGAGAKGIGYWTRDEFTQDTPAAIERRQATTLANLQLYLLRDWLATGKVHGLAPVRLGSTANVVRQGMTSGLVGSFNKLLAKPGPADALELQVQVPIIQCQHGLLILPQWLEQDGQFQPGPMRAEDVRIQLRGMGLVTHAWEVTTTDILAHNLRVDDGGSGGPELTLKRLDQTAAIVIPTDPRVIDQMRQEVQAIRETAANAWVNLAEMKLRRVVAVHDLLMSLELQPSQDSNASLRAAADSDAQLSAARRWLHEAQRQHQQGNFDATRVASEEVLRLTRIVQRQHWERAVQAVSSPIASPYTICFTTLPDFWRMTQTLSRARISQNNLMRAGSFEHWDALLAAGWQYHALSEGDGVETLIELNSGGAIGNCLRLAARPTDPENAPVVLDRAPIVYLSEPIPVESGQVVHIIGKVRIDSPVTNSRNGLMLYDNMSGSVGALRWMDGTPTNRWLPFELLRPVQSSGELRLTLELTGFGDVRFDEIQINTMTPGG